MDEKHDLERPYVRLFLTGLKSSPLAMYLAIIVPWTVIRLMDIGLRGITLIIALSIIPLAFISLFLVKAKPSLRETLLLIMSIGASAFFALSGLSNLFVIDRNSIPDIFILTMALLWGFITNYLDILDKNGLTVHGVNATNVLDSLLQGIGFGAPALVTGILRLLLGSDSVLFFVACALFLIAPWLKLHEKSRPVIDDENQRSGKELGRAVKLDVTASFILIFCTTFLFSLVTFVYAGNNGLFGYLGIAGGVVVALITIRRSGIVQVLILPAVAFTGILFMNDQSIATQVWYVLITGVLMGLMTGITAGKAYLLPRSPKKSSEGLALFWILFFIILASGLASEFFWLLRDEPEQKWWFIYLVLAAAAVVFMLIVFKQRGTRSILPVQSKPRALIPASIPLERKKKVAGVLLAAMVLIPAFSALFYISSGSVVYIALGRTMYDVDGNAVDAVDLPAESAKILLYSPSPNGTSHGESIRPGKSIRLGGYYYGFANGSNSLMSKADVIQWIGSTNDVFSFGFCGDLVQPADILAIRALNSGAKFYYMAFGTTLFEATGSNNTGPTWGGTHYPTVGFNTTMLEWTIKLANGSEAFGLRRSREHTDAHYMDIGNMEWADYFAWIYTNRAAEYHADGVAIDEILWSGYGNIEADNEGQSLRDYTSASQVHQACYNWLERLDNKTGMEVITQAFWPEAQVYQDGVWGEIAFRSGGPYGQRTDDRPADLFRDNSMDWAGIVQNARNLAEQGKSYIWAAWYKKDDTPGLEYAIATYLMAKPNNCTSLAFQPQPGFYPSEGLVGYAVKTAKEEIESHPEYFELEFGDALGEMQLKSGLGGMYYQREFENGIVLVNPFHAHLPGF
nr:hypothetical protein [Candidatus Sigynarchaeota archaeon]